MRDTKEIIHELLDRGLSAYDLKLLYIKETLDHFNGNKLQTARALGMNQSHLYCLINRYGWGRKE